MEKTAYIIDSSSFINEEEAKALGFYYIPLHVIIEGEDYLEGQTLDLEQLKVAIEQKKNVSTSQPSPGEIMTLIEKLKAEGYDNAVFSGIASGLSKTQQNMIATSQSEDFKVYNIDSKSVGNASKYPLIKVKKLVEDGMELEKAVAYVQENEALKSQTFLSVGDLFHLSRGGRISSAAAALGSMLKIKPILELNLDNDGQIDVVEKVRTSKKAFKRMAELLLNDLDDLNNYTILIADFYGEDVALEVLHAMQEVKPEIKIERYKLSPAIGVHTGLDSVGIQAVDTRILNQ